MAKRINLEEKQIWKEHVTGRDFVVIRRSGLNATICSVNGGCNKREMKYTTLKKYYKLVG